MHLSNAFYTLAAVTRLVTAAPHSHSHDHTTTHPNLNLNLNPLHARNPPPPNPTPFWAVLAWSNPSCTGTLLWWHHGSASTCRNGRLLAASYSWVVTQDTLFITRPEPSCGVIDPQRLAADPARGATPVRFDGEGEEGVKVHEGKGKVYPKGKSACSGGAVYGYDVVLFPELG